MAGKGHIRILWSLKLFKTTSAQLTNKCVFQDGLNKDGDLDESEGGVCLLAAGLPIFCVHGGNLIFTQLRAGLADPLLQGIPKLQTRRHVNIAVPAPPPRHSAVAGLSLTKRTLVSINSSGEIRRTVTRKQSCQNPLL